MYACLPEQLWYTAAGPAAGAGERDLVQAELGLDAEAAHGQGLERLGARPRVDDQRGVTDGGEQVAVGVGHGGRAEVAALDEPGSLDLDEDLHARLPWTTARRSLRG